MPAGTPKAVFGYGDSVLTRGGLALGVLVDDVDVFEVDGPGGLALGVVRHTSHRLIVDVLVIVDALQARVAAFRVAADSFKHIPTE